MVLKRYVFAIACLCLVSVVNAQKVDEALQQRLYSDYPEDPMIYLKYYEDMDIAVAGDSLVVSSQRLEHRAYLSDQSSAFAKDQVYTNSFYALEDLKAYSLIPSGKKFETLEVKDFKESSNMESFIFYDDSKYLSFLYPGIQKGAQSVLSYTQLMNEPRFGNSFYFQTFVPIDHARFSVTADASVKIDFSSFHMEGFTIKQSEEVLKNGRKKYTFEAFQMKKVERESEAPKMNYFTPHVIMRIAEFTNSRNQIVEVLKTPDDLYAWYKEFVGDIAFEKDDRIQKIVDEIIEESDSDLEKVRKIYYWVQDNIKYIAFEDGMRGFVPHPGGYVCEKRYGDCKDMASIIVNMLHHAGIEAYFTWVGSRDIPYKYSELPTPMVDNHMIAAYKADGKTYFLDATAQYLTFPFPSSMIQGKETLIGLGENYEIQQIPIIDASENVMNDTIRLSLSEPGIVGTGSVTMTGYARMFNAHRLIKADERNVENYLTRLLAKGNNKFLIDDYSIANLYDRDHPITIDYTFNISDYHRIVNDEIYINLNMDKSYQNSLIDDTRKLAIENEYQYTNKTVSILEIPEDYEPSYIPADVSFDNDVFSFSINYTNNAGHITMDKTFQVKYLLLTPAQFESHNKAVKELTNAYREAIILSKKENP
jgi:hypothetical protein